MTNDDRYDSYSLISAGLSGDYVLLFQTIRVTGTARASYNNGASGVNLYLMMHGDTSSELARSVTSADSGTYINKSFEYTIDGSTAVTPDSSISIRSFLSSSPGGGTARCSVQLECTLVTYGVKFS